MENKQTAMYDFLVHIRKMKKQLMSDYQNGNASYYMVKIFEGLELKAYGFLAQEKEQIIDAHGIKNRGGFKSNGNFFVDEFTGEQYYNETYGK